MWDPNHDAITNAVLILQAAGWEIADGDGSHVEMSHPNGDVNIVIEFGSPNEEQ